MSGLAGKWMRVQNGATVYKVTDGDWECATDWNDTTNCESGPDAATGNVQEEAVPNVKSGRMRLTVIFRPQDGVYASLTDGASYPLIFYPDKTLTSSFLSGVIS